MDKKEKTTLPAPPSGGKNKVVTLASGTTGPRRVKTCTHRGELVRVGQFSIKAGGTYDLLPQDLEGIDVLIPLLESVPFGFGRRYSVLAAPLVDYGGVPSNWRAFLEGDVIPLLESGASVLTFCMGSHGRTGTILASLIALLEDPAETPDPIEAARARHCRKAVETERQAVAIFALRGEELPDKYVREFYRPPVTRKGPRSPR